MKAAILGVGRMGTAICYAMHKLGFYVVGMDSNEAAGAHFRDYIDGPNGAFYVTDQNNADKSMERALLFEKPDIVISSLPYHQTEEIAYWCISNELRYCDLGGRVDVSANINKDAKENAKLPIMTDLGLAPGWINILAEEGRKKTGGANTIGMYVGGLPATLTPAKNPLKYELTWSVDGLINEYRDDCEVLVNGEVCRAQGMDGYERLNFRGLELEAFFTSGGASHTIKSMKDAGVKNCYYKTLRYPGHRDMVNFLLRECDLDDEALRKIFENGCEAKSADIVWMYVKSKNGSLEWKRQIEILPDDNFSAMQRATAFSIASVAAIMAQGKLEGDKEQHRDYWTQYPKNLSYSDIPIDEFEEKLTELGLLPDGLAWDE